MVLVDDCLSLELTHWLAQAGWCQCGQGWFKGQLWECNQLQQNNIRDHSQWDVAICPFSSNTAESSQGLPVQSAAWANDNLYNARAKSNALNLVFYSLPSDKTEFIGKLIICGILWCVSQDGNSSHRPLREGKCSDLVISFSSSMGPTVINQTCCLWLIHMYERLPMTYNPVIMRKGYQIGMRYRCVTTSQYFRSSATKSRRKLDTLTLFYHFISCCILCYVVWMNTMTQRSHVWNRFLMPTFCHTW